MFKLKLEWKGCDELEKRKKERMRSLCVQVGGLLADLLNIQAVTLDAQLMHGHRIIDHEKRR